MSHDEHAERGRQNLNRLLEALNKRNPPKEPEPKKTAKQKQKERAKKKEWKDKLREIRPELSEE
jgi:hypothetical protein